MTNAAVGLAADYQEVVLRIFFVEVIIRNIHYPARIGATSKCDEEHDEQEGTRREIFKKANLLLPIKAAL